MTQSALFLLLAIILFLGLTLIAWRAKKIQARRDDMSLDELLAKLEPMGKARISAVGSGAWPSSHHGFDPRDSLKREPPEVWDSIGGIAGLETMRRNAEVLIELAYYVHRWNPDAIEVAEQLRLDANEIRASLSNVQEAMRSGALATAFPLQAACATVAYYLMTQKVCALYEIRQVGWHSRLKAAL